MDKSLFRLNGLPKMAVKSGGECFALIFFADKCRQRQSWSAPGSFLRFHGSNLPDETVAVLSGHADIADQQISIELLYD